VKAVLLLFWSKLQGYLSELMYRWLVGLLGVGRWLLTCKILPFIYFLGGGIGVFKLSVQIALIIDLFL